MHMKERPRGSQWGLGEWERKRRDKKELRLLHWRYAGKGKAEQKGKWNPGKKKGKGKERTKSGGKEKFKKLKNRT